MHACMQVKEMSKQMESIVLRSTKQSIKKLSGKCNSARLTTIFEHSDSIPEPTDDPDKNDHPLSECKVLPYTKYTKPRGPLLKDLRNETTNYNGRDPIARLLFSPIIDKVLSVLLTRLPKNMQRFINAEQEWLLDWLNKCERLTVRHSTTAEAPPIQRLYQIVAQSVEQIANQFTVIGQHNWRVYMMRDLRGLLNDSMHEQLIAYARLH
jgi:T-complex protein 11